MNVICNVFNRPRSVSTLMNVQMREKEKKKKKLREFPAKLERAE